MNKANECTCPSGDGSLVHPCPAHPAVEQAGANVGHGHVFPRADGVKMRCGGPGLCSECTADASRARAALAQPSQSQYEASFEEWLANELEGEDGQPVPAAVCDIALARRAFNHWPKLEQPAKVGGVRFSAGVSSRLVVEAAQRLYEFESTPEKEAERPEVVAVRYEDGTILSAEECGIALEVCAKVQTPLMTVSQHERIVGALRAEITQLRQHKNDYMDAGQETYRALQNEIREREAEIARLDGLVSSRTTERDAALARVEQQERTIAGMNEAHAKLAGLYEAAQAQHSVPAAWYYDAPSQAEAAIIDIRGMWGEDDCPTYEDVASALRRLLAAAPGKEVPQAWIDVQAERRRQVEAEGWTPEHDDLYCAAELPRAAAAYILNGANDEAPAIWPFSAKWWKPRDARSNYVRASALILAEIERLDRAAHGKEGV